MYFAAGRLPRPGILPGASRGRSCTSSRGRHLQAANGFPRESREMRSRSDFVRIVCAPSLSGVRPGCGVWSRKSSAKSSSNTSKFPPPCTSSVFRRTTAFAAFTRIVDRHGLLHSLLLAREPIRARSVAWLGRSGSSAELAEYPRAAAQTLKVLASCFSRADASCHGIQIHGSHADSRVRVLRGQPRSRLKLEVRKRKNPAHSWRNSQTARGSRGEFGSRPARLDHYVGSRWPRFNPISHVLGRLPPTRKEASSRASLCFVGQGGRGRPLGGVSFGPSFGLRSPFEESHRSWPVAPGLEVRRVAHLESEGS